MNALFRLGAVQRKAFSQRPAAYRHVITQRNLFISVPTFAKTKVTASKLTKKKAAAATDKLSSGEDYDDAPPSALASALESVAAEKKSKSGSSDSSALRKGGAASASSPTKKPRAATITEGKTGISTKKTKKSDKAPEEPQETLVQKPKTGKAPSKTTTAASVKKPTKKVVQKKTKNTQQFEDDDDDDERYLSAEELEDLNPEEDEHERSILDRINREVDEMEAKKAKKLEKKKKGTHASKSDALSSDVDADLAVQRAAAEAQALESAEQTVQDELMRSIVQILREEGGRDIVAIDVGRKTNWVNSLILVTGMVSRHNVALANKLRTELRSLGLVRSTKIERNEDDEWIIVNCGSALVEIMTEEQRAALDLERLWVLKQEETQALHSDVESAEFTYDDEDGTSEIADVTLDGILIHESKQNLLAAVKVEPGAIPETKKRGNSAMSQQYNDYNDKDDDVDVDFGDDVLPGRVMEEYKSKTQEKKAKRKGFKK